MDRLTVLVVIFTICLNSGLGEIISYSEIKELLQIGGPVKITEISKNRISKSLNPSFENTIENFFKSNDITVDAPFGSTLTFSGRHMDNEEIDLKIQLGSVKDVEARKKSKIKKVLAPIAVLLLLKAITLIPLAVGILGIKTWNALQLSFISFVTSIVLAVWKLCSKISPSSPVTPHVIHEAVHDVHVPHIYHDDHHVHHHDSHNHPQEIHYDLHHDLYHDHPDQHHFDPWDHHYHRSDDNAQQVAYNGYVPENKT
ncbi:uncharacterized protein LOC126746233 [Anthonomus grandis grandis]|uniref:uncharacterized protein LOC126746233 n=1 Tax=Anthonomus grandis grandis TaxID=2921223 RepID=UPI002165BACD|nr:uncharacterized protein LOC126746233 [Anthonomus grandis grandis]